MGAGERLEGMMRLRTSTTRTSECEERSESTRRPLTRSPFHSDDEEDLATTSFAVSQNDLSRPDYSRADRSYAGSAPLTAHAQQPAGFGQGQLGERSAPKNMLDDDDELVQAKARIAARQAKSQRALEARGTLEGLWKDVKRVVMGGPRVYQGERVVHLNNETMNKAEKWPGNSVSTSKYNIVTFLPKFLAGAFCFSLAFLRSFRDALV